MLSRSLCVCTKLNVVFLSRLVFWQNTSFNFAKGWLSFIIFFCLYAAKIPLSFCRLFCLFTMNANNLLTPFTLPFLKRGIVPPAVGSSSRYSMKSFNRVARLRLPFLRPTGFPLWPFFHGVKFSTLPRSVIASLVYGVLSVIACKGVICSFTGLREGGCHYGFFVPPLCLFRHEQN